MRLLDPGAYDTNPVCLMRNLCVSCSLFFQLASVCGALHGYKASRERKQELTLIKPKKPEKVSIESLSFLLGEKLDLV